LGPTVPVFHTRRRKEKTTRTKNTKTKLEGRLQEEVVRFKNEVQFEKFMDIFSRKPKVIRSMLAPNTESNEQENDNILQNIQLLENEDGYTAQ
jgi:hypothetical protein